MFRTHQLLSALLAATAMTSAAMAQTTAVYNGGNADYSNPASWNIGVVPVNGGGTTYNVAVPSGLLRTCLKTLIPAESGAA